uniref:Uncharacterized protein n=1 Tax=Helianthus annuus TaxID=4232 RepID=A0A251U6W4_HELAN
MLSITFFFNIIESSPEFFSCSRHRVWEKNKPATHFASSPETPEVHSRNTPFVTFGNRSSTLQSSEDEDVARTETRLDVFRIIALVRSLGCFPTFTRALFRESIIRNHCEYTRISPFYFYHFWGVTCLPINLHMNTLLNT